jgi:hypothetical protein
VFLEPLTIQGIPDDLRIASNDPTKLLLSIPLTTDVRDLEVETIALTAEEEIPLGEALIIQVIPAEFVHVESGSLFHRPATGGDFEHVELVPVGGALIGVVPRTSVTEVGLQYYVKVENSEIFRFDPPGAPDSLFFQAVASPNAVTAAPQAGSGGRFLKGQGIPVVVQLDAGTVFVEGLLHYRRAGQSDYDSTSLVVTEAGPAASIPAEFVESRGVEYWVAVTTQTNSLITDPPTNPRTVPRTIRTAVLREEEGTSTPGRRYRMLSVPLEFDPEFDGTLEDILRDEDEFGPPDPAKWRAFRYVPSSGTVELVDDPRFRPEPGQAFWLISRSDHRVDSAPIEAMSTRSDRKFEVVLAREWNQFGSPFVFPVAWDSVTTSSDAIGDPVAFDPSLRTAGYYAQEPPTVLTPFQGYFIRNDSSQPETLWIPPIEATEAAVRAGPSAIALPEWALRLEAASPAAQGGTITLGVHPRADPEFDSLDREMPPSPPGSWVHLAIDNSGWSRRPGPYRRDLREVGAKGHLWNIDLRTDELAADVTVAATLSGGVPGEWEVRLIDVEQSVSTDLNAESDYRLVSFGPSRAYRLAVVAGTAEYLSQIGSELVTIPIALSLNANAPNPFRGATRIRFGLPREQRVTLGIYGLQGRRVFTLVDRRRMPAGYHSEIWQGRDQLGRRVASGIYFYRLQTEDGVRTRKLLVLR